MPVVCISGFSTIIDTFVRDGSAYAGRTTFAEMDAVLKGGTHGVMSRVHSIRANAMKSNRSSTRRANSGETSAASPSTP